MPPAPQILQLYKDYIDPEFTWSNFTLEEQAKVIVAPRSNNLLDTARVRRTGAARALEQGEGAEVAALGVLMGRASFAACLRRPRPAHDLPAGLAPVRGPAPPPATCTPPHAARPPSARLNLDPSPAPAHCCPLIAPPPD